MANSHGAKNSTKAKSSLITSPLKVDFVRSRTSEAARTEARAARAGIEVDNLILSKSAIKVMDRWPIIQLAGWTKVKRGAARTKSAPVPAK